MKRNKHFTPISSQPTTAKRATTKTTAGSSRQAQLSFAPAARGSTRAAAIKARKTIAVRMYGGDASCSTNAYIGR